MKDNPLRKLETLGQSIWLDYIRRDLMVSGELRRLIEEESSEEELRQFLSLSEK